MDKQSLNINSDFTSVFFKTVIAIVLIYGFIITIHFLRDKFINKETVSKAPQITDLLGILNRLFHFAGFGFIIGNIILVILTQADFTYNKQLIFLRGEWDYLTFGIILIFIGIGFKSAKKLLHKDRSNY